MLDIDGLKCRVCGATEPKGEPPDSPLYGNWEIAAPTDDFEGELLLANSDVWCSKECRNLDPRYRPFAGGEDMANSYQRFGEAHGCDLIGALAKSRGVSREKASELLSDGAGKALKQLRKRGRL
jgi:hypothetical protein